MVPTSVVLDKRGRPSLIQRCMIKLDGVFLGGLIGEGMVLDLDNIAQSTCHLIIAHYCCCLGPPSVGNVTVAWCIDRHENLVRVVDFCNQLSLL